MLQSCPLPGPNASTESTVAVEMRHPTVHHLSAAASDLLPPPKRCHSWNGLADLASPAISPTGSSLSPKLRKIGGGPNRPRSLNLSMSNLSVPPAVLELTAKVDSELVGCRKGHIGLSIYRGASADNILEMSEGSEGSLSNSNSGPSLSHPDLSDVTPKQLQPSALVFGELEHGSQLDQLLLVKDFSVSHPTLSPATPTATRVGCEAKKAPAQLELTMSQPLLKSFQGSLDQLKTSIREAHTAPSDLSKVVIVDASSSLQDSRRRSHSLGNLISPSFPCDNAGLCMKCGRVGKHRLCHGATHTTADWTADYVTRPTSLHGSLEMIQVL